ncbi:SAM-dependent methyltransferase [Streptomyces sp. SAI-133]|nr:SAM-dependent methyltransferase [Streptomyces sp. SAI-133]
MPTTQDTPPEKPRETAVYTHGHHESVLRSHTWRTAANSAAYLLGSLKPHMRILDIGCGPGTITADLAALVPGGRVTGVDHAAGILDQARATAAARGLTNVDFAVADVHALDFPDDAFCVVHAHQVLQHVGDPVQALREMKRVTRPGGLIAVRDSDYAAMTWYPATAGLDDWLDLYRRVARANGGEPDAGRRLKSWALRAGADGHHRELRHLDLLHRRGAGMVERAVGGPHAGLRLCGAGHRGRPRHPGAAAGRRGRLAGMGRTGRRLVLCAPRRDPVPERRLNHWPSWFSPGVIPGAATVRAARGPGSGPRAAVRTARAVRSCARRGA